MQALSEQAEDFLTWTETEHGRGISTIRSYRSDLKAFELWLVENGGDPSNPALEDARLYVDARLDMPLMRSTIERSATTLRRYFLFRGEREVRNVLARVTRPESYLRAADEFVVTRALDRLPSQSPSEKRNRAMAEVSYSCALRVRDVIALTMSDVEENTIVVGGQRRPLGAEASRALDSWLGSQGRSLLAKHHGVDLNPTRLFVSNAGQPLTRQGVNYVFNQTTGFMPYVFRDSCARHMIDRGSPIDAVRTMLGVSVADQHYKIDFSALQEVHRRCHPRG